jgi:hypothetical protein
MWKENTFIDSLCKTTKQPKKTRLDEEAAYEKMVKKENENELFLMIEPTTI